jgi:Ulp1 protease family, C-terminal catalytic domain
MQNTLSAQVPSACMQGVDIFAKDWLFVPIHDHLHWSLVLVAHPGVLPGTDPDREQCIIHFDSMEGGEQRWQVWLRTSRDHPRAVLPAIKYKGTIRVWFLATRV